MSLDLSYLLANCCWCMSKALKMAISKANLWIFEHLNAPAIVLASSLTVQHQICSRHVRHAQQNTPLCYWVNSGRSFGLSWSPSGGRAERHFIGWRLTRIHQFEPLPGAFRVAVKFQPEMVGSGDQGESQHGGSGECSKNVRRVVFTVINLKHNRVYSLKSVNMKVVHCFSVSNTFSLHCFCVSEHNHRPVEQGRTHTAFLLSPQSCFRLTTVPRTGSQSDVNSSATDRYFI